MWIVSLLWKQVSPPTQQGFAVPILSSFLLLLAKLAVNSEVLWAKGRHCESSPENPVSAQLRHHGLSQLGKSFNLSESLYPISVPANCSPDPGVCNNFRSVSGGFPTIPGGGGEGTPGHLACEQLSS